MYFTLKWQGKTLTRFVCHSARIFCTNILDYNKHSKMQKLISSIRLRPLLLTLPIYDQCADVLVIDFLLDVYFQKFLKDNETTISWSKNSYQIYVWEYISMLFIFIIINIRLIINYKVMISMFAIFTFWIHCYLSCLV